MAIKRTIYQALCDKLGREPTYAEVNEDVRRILDEALAKLASEITLLGTRGLTR